MKQMILDFTKIGFASLQEVGLKNASIGEIYNSLCKHGVNVPLGFAITVTAFKYVRQYNQLDDKLAMLFSQIDNKDYSNLSQIALQARKLIVNSKFPKDLENAVLEAYQNIFYHKNQDVAVRSSTPTAHGGAAQSPESFLNISGPIALLYTIKCCYASLYSEDAILQREILGLSQTDVEISVGIQQMVRSDMACAGIAQTGNDNISIKGSWGLGQNFEANHIKPDEFIIPKTFLSHTDAAGTKNLGSKSRMLVYNELAAGNNTTISKSTPGELREEFILQDTELQSLSRSINCIAGLYKTEVAIEWAKDGIDSKLYIVQAQSLQQ